MWRVFSCLLAMKVALPPVAKPAGKSCAFAPVRSGRACPKWGARGGLLSGDPGQKAWPNSEGRSDPKGSGRLKRREPPRDWARRYLLENTRAANNTRDKAVAKHSAPKTYASGIKH